MKYIFTILTIFIAHTSSACPAPKKLTEFMLRNSNSIFSGHVSGVHLTEWQECKSFANNRSEENPSKLCFSDATENFKTWIVVTKQIKGVQSKVKSIELGGCGVVIPRVKEYGLFALDTHNNEWVAVFESEPMFEKLFSVAKNINNQN